MEGNSVTKEVWIVSLSFVHESFTYNLTWLVRKMVYGTIPTPSSGRDVLSETGSLLNILSRSSELITCDDGHVDLRGSLIPSGSNKWTDGVGNLKLEKLLSLIELSDLGVSESFSGLCIIERLEVITTYLLNWLIRLNGSIWVLEYINFSYLFEVPFIPFKSPSYKGFGKNFPYQRSTPPLKNIRGLNLKRFILGFTTFTTPSLGWPGYPSLVETDILLSVLPPVVSEVSHP